MPQNYPLEIITPEKVFFSGEVESVIVPTPDGYLGIMRKHEPMVIALKVGRMKIKIEEKWKDCVMSEGFIEIRPDKTVIFSQAAEWPGEINMKRAREARDAANEKLREKMSRQEYQNTIVALERAMARLQLGDKHVDYD